MECNIICGMQVKGAYGMQAKVKMCSIKFIWKKMKKDSNQRVKHVLEEIRKRRANETQVKQKEEIIVTAGISEK